MVGRDLRRRCSAGVDGAGERLAFCRRQRKALDVPAVQAALESALERQPIPYDKSGEEHYNVISAFIKSIRDSDPHAGLVLLGADDRGGRGSAVYRAPSGDPSFRGRGQRGPSRAFRLRIAVKEAVEFIGMPEGRISLRKR